VPIILKNFEITIDGTTYRCRGPEAIISSKRRLICSLTRFFKKDGTPEYSDGAFLERVHAFKSVFARVFPGAPAFSEVSCVFADFSEWKYWLSDIADRHVEWAKAAKACGLIDTYIVDYEPSVEEE